MKTITSLIAVVVILAANSVNYSAYCATGSAADEPTDIKLEDTPLDVAIQTLAELAGVNVHIDQKIRAPIVKPDGAVQTNFVSLRWKGITPKNAFKALIANYDLVATVDQDTGVTRITMKDPTALEPLQVHVVDLKYANPTSVVDVVKTTLGQRSKIMADARTSQVIVMAPQSELTQITNLIAELDSPLHQILIEARFIETSKNPKSVKGIDWSGTLAEQNFTFGNGKTTGEIITQTPGAPVSSTVPLPSGRTVTTTTTPEYSSQGTLSTTVGAGGISADTTRGWFPHAAFLNADGVKAVLSFLNTENDTESIATPRAVTLEGNQVELSVVQYVPVFEEQQGALVAGGAQPSTVKPNYNLTVGQLQTPLNKVGIVLIVTPRVVGTNAIQLKLEPNISVKEAIPERATLGGKVNESPIFTHRTLSTIATVPNQHTLVLGGLINHSTTKVYSKVPLLGDIPILGYAFRRDSKERNKRNLLIFVTPTIISEDDYQKPLPSTLNFLKSKPLERPDVEEPAWDSGAPKDKTRSMF
ncbi:MAG: hypothetical protein N2487_02855 [Verrucomicrobiae bacterium]|nr:hypothetical protein [Verrucomicrobiae bacterium]